YAFSAGCDRCFASTRVLETREMVGKILIPEIRSLIEARDFAGLRELFSDWPPADVAEVIVDMPEDERVIIFRVLPAALAADVFEYLEVDAQQELLRSMAREQVVAILNEIGRASCRERGEGTVARSAIMKRQRTKV